CGKYILTYHKLFDGLINNCTAYDNGECSQCENGYQNNGTSCRDIRENTCDTYSGTTCTKCTSENLLVDNECVSKTSLHCQTSNGVSCTECNSDYHDENGTCAKGYVENCSVYDGENCQTCNSDNLVVSLNNSCVAGKIENGITMYNVGNSYVVVGAKAREYSSVGTVDIYGNGNQSGNYWAGAVDECDKKNMDLPTITQLQQMQQSNPELFLGGSYWSSSDAATGSCGGGIVCPGFKNVQKQIMHSDGSADDFNMSDNYHIVLCVPR
ncbi:hypothetical protein IJ732_01085, partial [bacterium]|nr:hypothetical protein [bacterium]